MVCSSNPVRGMRFLLSPEYPDRLWGPPSLVFIGYGVLSQGRSGQDMKLTTHLHLPLFPLYAFMECIGKTLLLQVWCFFTTLIKKYKLSIFQTRMQRGGYLGLREIV
jgi:hypothetical protein